MSPDVNKPASAKSAGKDETQSSAGRKSASGRPQEPVLKCPRCDSPNTKFCYYNNYSLTQPRHFCKTCRRYWTKGGALRNVPIGGGCRKNKKLKSSPRLSGESSKDHSSGSSDHHIGGLKFFQGISPAMDFQLGGVNYPRIHHPSANAALFSQFSPFGDISNTCGAISSNPCFNNLDIPSAAGTSSPLMGFNFPFSNPAALKQGEAINNNINFQEVPGSLHVPSSVATSIESLSCMNQDLHWKLQQQRLAMLFVGDSNNNNNDNNNNNNQKDSSIDLSEKPLQPILFENLDISKPDESCGIGSRKDGAGGGNLSTEWYFDNSYATVSSTPATSSSNVNEMMNNSSSNWNGGGIQAWSDHMSNYTSLP